MVVLTACYTATPSFDVPCDPARARCPTGQACIAGIEGFACMPEGTPAAIDAGHSSIDAPMPRSSACAPSDPSQRACFTFDNSPLASPLANEASVGVAIDLTNVTQIPVGSGGAALLSTQSAMYIPPNTHLTNLVAIDVRIRLDAPVATRVGVLDADATEPALSMFLYSDPMRMRCTLNNGILYAEVSLEVGVWMELACTCENNMLNAYRDGVRVGQRSGCSPGAATTQGLQIGQNSRVDQMLPPDEPFVGAIDRVRLWTAVPTY